MGLQLRHHAFQAAQRADGDQLAVGVGEQVAGEDVAEEMRLEVVVLGGAEVIVERLPAELRLHLGALLEGIVATRQRRRFGTYLHIATLLHHFLESPQRVE